MYTHPQIVRVTILSVQLLKPLSVALKKGKRIIKKIPANIFQTFPGEEVQRK